MAVGDLVEDIGEPRLRIDIVHLAGFDQRGVDGPISSALVRAGERIEFRARARWAAWRARRRCCRFRSAHRRGSGSGPPSARARSGSPRRVSICRRQRRAWPPTGLHRLEDRSGAGLAGGQPRRSSEPPDIAFDGVEAADPRQRLDGDRGRVRGLDVEEVSPRVRPACVRESPGKEDGCDLKPFKATQRVRRPPGKGGARQPEASLAWRRQRRS